MSNEDKLLLAEGCDSCYWYIEHFNLDDLGVFHNTFRGKDCLNPFPRAIPIKETGLNYYDERMRKINVPKD
jgi:hypothetical protein